MKGIDVSEWNNILDYSILKNQGIEFAIIRTGYGRDITQKDKLFENHYNGFTKNNIKLGCYHYSYATSIENAKKEYEVCYNIIKDKNFDLPIFYDLEDETVLKLGRIEITQIAIDFIKYMNSKGIKAGIYANKNWFINYIDIDKIIEIGGYIWLAEWSEKITLNKKINFWQYTSKSTYNGIQGKVDGDEIIEYKIETNNNLNNINYSTGHYIVNVKSSLNVRENPSLNSRIKTFGEFTKNAQNQILKIAGYKMNGLPRNVECDVSKIVYSDNFHFGLIPSGWIALEYCKKV